MSHTPGETGETRARDSHGRFAKEVVSEFKDGADLDGAAYKAELERAKALHEIQTQEAAEAEVMRVQVCDADVHTIPCLQWP